MLWGLFGTRRFFRLYSPTAHDHLYTTSRKERRASVRQGYVEEPWVGRVKVRKSARTVLLYRLDRAENEASVPRDHVYAVTSTERDVFMSGGYAAGKSPGYVYTAPWPMTLPLYELSHQEVPRHFYTTDEAEARRVGPQNGYGEPRLVFHVLNDLAPSARWAAFFALVAFLSIEGALGLYSWRHGTGQEGFQKLVSAWPLLAGVGLATLAIAGALIGRRRLAALGGRFESVFRSGA